MEEGEQTLPLRRNEGFGATLCIGETIDSSLQYNTLPPLSLELPPRRKHQLAESSKLPNNYFL